MVKIISDPGTRQQQLKKQQKRQIEAVAKKEGLTVKQVKARVKNQRAFERALVNKKDTSKFIPKTTISSFSEPTEVPDTVFIKSSKGTIGFSVAREVQDKFLKSRGIQTTQQQKVKQEPVKIERINKTTPVIVPKEATIGETALGLNLAIETTIAKQKQTKELEKVLATPTGTEFEIKDDTGSKVISKQEAIKNITNIKFSDTIDLRLPEFGIANRDFLTTRQIRLEESIEKQRRKGKIISDRTAFERFLIRGAKGFENLGAKEVKVFEKAAIPSILKPGLAPNIEFTTGRKQTLPDLGLQAGLSGLTGAGSFIFRGGAELLRSGRGVIEEQRTGKEIIGQAGVLGLSFAIGSVQFIKQEPEQALILGAVGRNIRFKKGLIKVKTPFRQQLKNVFGEPILSKTDIKGVAADTFGSKFVTGKTTGTILEQTQGKLPIKIIEPRTRPTIVRTQKIQLETIKPKPLNVETNIQRPKGSIVNEFNKKRLKREQRTKDLIIDEFRLKQEIKRVRDTVPLPTQITIIDRPSNIKTITDILDETKKPKQELFTFESQVDINQASLFKVRKELSGKNKLGKQTRDLAYIDLDLKKIGDTIFPESKKRGLTGVERLEIQTALGETLQLETRIKPKTKGGSKKIDPFVDFKPKDTGFKVISFDSLAAKKQLFDTFFKLDTKASLSKGGFLTEAQFKKQFLTKKSRPRPKKKQDTIIAAELVPARAIIKEIRKTVFGKQEQRPTQLREPFIKPGARRKLTKPGFNRQFFQDFNTGLKGNINLKTQQGVIPKEKTLLATGTKAQLQPGVITGLSGLIQPVITDGVFNVKDVNLSTELRRTNKQSVTNKQIFRTKQTNQIIGDVQTLKPKIISINLGTTKPTFSRPMKKPFINPRLRQPQPRPPQPKPPQPKTPMFGKDDKFIRPIKFMGEKPQPGYDVYVKVKGKDVKVNKKPFRKTRALDFLGDVLDNSASASGKIKPSKKNAVDQGLILAPFNKSKFRKSKGRYVEYRKNRIDTPGEIKGISAKGWAAKRLKGSRSRILKRLGL